MKLGLSGYKEYVETVINHLKISVQSIIFHKHVPVHPYCFFLHCHMYSFTITPFLNSFPPLSSCITYTHTRTYMYTSADITC